MTDYEGEHRETEDEAKPGWMNDKVYNALKPMALIVLPAFATFYLTLGQVWGLPATDKVVATVVAVDTFLGVILGLAGRAYQNSPARFDGAVIVNQTQTGVARYSLEFEKPLEESTTKDELVLKVSKPDL